MRGPSGLGHLLIGQPELSESLMRGLALKGQLPQYLGSELEPSVTVADLTDPEFLYLRRTTRFWVNASLNAVAAQFSQAAFAPIATAPRTLALVESIIIANSTGGAIAVLVDCIPSTLIGFAAGTPKSSLDDRAIPFGQLQPTPSFGVVNATAAAGLLAGSNAPVIAVPANTTFVLPINAVFTARSVIATPAPSYLIAQVSNVNIATNIGFIWRERPLLATEAQ